MITLRKNAERRHVRRDQYVAWLTFHARERPDPLTAGLGPLAALDEVRLPPGRGALPLPGADADILTYVARGALAQWSSTGASGLIRAGEFRCVPAARAARQRDTNPSRSAWAHAFRVELRPADTRLGFATDHKRFPVAQRRNLLCLVASPDGREGSLRYHQDAFVYSGVLEPGYHVIRELLPGHGAWLHLVDGEVSLHGLILTRGDGVGVTMEPSVSLTARESSEILLLELVAPSSPFETRGAVTGRQERSRIDEGGDESGPPGNV